ncbi:MAG: hypothetical protein IIV02_06060 [Peptococcaceae bacterium]|nr:hypothetical protein [Peptococcaceae bacterium]
MFLYPGQGSKKFTVKRPVPGISKNGRVSANAYENVHEFMGVLTSAAPKEQEQWRQSGHPVTHKIVEPLPKGDNKPVPGDIVCLDGRLFTIQGIRNPGELNHYNVYYCEERRDVQCPK